MAVKRWRISEGLSTLVSLILSSILILNNCNSNRIETSSKNSNGIIPSKWKTKRVLLIWLSPLGLEVVLQSDGDGSKIFLAIASVIMLRIIFVDYRMLVLNMRNLQLNKALLPKYYLVNSQADGQMKTS